MDLAGKQDDTAVHAIWQAIRNATHELLSQCEGHNQLAAESRICTCNGNLLGKPTSRSLMG